MTMNTLRLRPFAIYVFWVIALALLLTGVGACGDPFEEDEPYTRPVGPGTWVLVDLYHTRLQNPEDYRLYKGNYAYQGVFGFHRLFEHLGANDYHWSSIRTMELSGPRLEGFDVLFINLVQSDRPDFTDEEVEVIKDFVHRGGGLFVIADHTNVYRHAERINRFLIPMGIEVMYHTAVDYPPEHSVGGNGWIMLKSFADHPVAADLDMVSFQTGGALDSEHGVCFTSDRSFADFWDESDSGGYYGDWTHNGDDELEPRGPLAGVAAAQYGQGRVVVAADQNMFGDAWLHFGNNFELALNSFEWTAGREADEVNLRHTRPKGLNIGLESSHNNFNTGRTASQGYYTFFVHLNRDEEVTARATTRLNDDHDVLMLLSPSIAYEPDQIEVIRGYLREGKKVVVMFDTNDLSSATIELVQSLAPDFTIDIAGQTHPLDEGLRNGAVRASIPRIDGPLPLSSTQLEVNGLRLATKRSNEDAPGFMLDLTSSWGAPFLSVEHDSGIIDVARTKVVDGGELIIFIQDGFWRNQTMGRKETTPPTPENQDNVDLEYRFLDYLKKTDG